MNENFGILIKISLKFVPKGPINNNPALFYIMAWCRTNADQIHWRINVAQGGMSFKQIKYLAKCKR